MAKSLLFVCLFNAGRSAAAEYFVRRMLQQRDEELAHQIRVSSAGLVTKEGVQYLKDFGIPLPRPFFGRPPHGYLVTLMARRGIDITGHRSRGLNRLLLDEADLVVIFGHDQEALISSLWPHVKGKMLTFPELTEGQFAVPFDYYPEPFPDGDFVDYDVERMAPIIADIERGLTRAMDKLLRYLEAR